MPTRAIGRRLSSTIERANLGPNLTDAEKKRYTQIGLLAADQSQEQSEDRLSTAEKVLKDDPKNLNALVTLVRCSVRNHADDRWACARPLRSHEPSTSRSRLLRLPKPARGSGRAVESDPVATPRNLCLMLLNQMKYPGARLLRPGGSQDQSQGQLCLVSHRTESQGIPRGIDQEVQSTARQDTTKTVQQPTRLLWTK